MSEQQDRLGPSSSAPAPFGSAHYAHFYAERPQVRAASGASWLARGQNFLVEVTEGTTGHILDRSEQTDEFLLLLPDRTAGARISADGEELAVPGRSIVVIPPGPSRIELSSDGIAVRIFTTRAEDLVARCLNAAAYAERQPNIPPLVPWPDPPGGHRIRAYDLDVPPVPSRFGRIFCCSTIMVNFLEPRLGARDPRMMSPHHHEDFEQGSLALEGEYLHCLRWPWIKDMTMWRDDEFVPMRAPSLVVVPPLVVHTSQAIGDGMNQLVDIFCPPRRDFAQKEGWILNAADYPSPDFS